MTINGHKLYSADATLDSAYIQIEGATKEECAECRVAYKEAKTDEEKDEFLGLLSVEQRNMIPQKLRDLFSKEKDKEYIKGIDPTIPIKDQDLKEETLGLIAWLNLEYWCQDEQEKERLKMIYAENERKYQEVFQLKFNPDNIFKKKEIVAEDDKEQVQCLQIVERKESLFKRIIDKVLGLFKIG